MNRTKKEGQCAEGKPPPAEVPIGWQRRITYSGVVYISPSGLVLACLEQVKSYLLTDGTCKCGLECPLIIHKIFNFDPGAAIKQRTAEDARADANVTKLCIHKRKVITVATLHRSMESPHPALASQGVGTAGTAAMGPFSHQAIRNNMHNGPPNSVALDGRNPNKMGMSVSGQQYYNHELGSPPQRDLYLGYSRTRLGGSEHSSQQRAPYHSRHSVLLSPSSSTSCCSQHYGDRAPSPRTEPLGSPDPNMLGFHGACSPGSAHMNGDCFTRLSPPSILHHGSPLATQPSCAMSGRTNVPNSPAVNAKSLNMQKPSCSFPHDFQHKPQPACHPQSHFSLSQLPHCILQKKQVTSEKDPLGILDPIPSKAPSQGPLVPNVSGLQHNAQSQVPPLNVNIPPASVPLPSNLPLPTGKSGPVGHGHRVQHHPTLSSASSSPIMSPAHMAGPVLAKVESPHRSRCLSSSSEHGSFSHPTGLQVPCGGSKPLPRGGSKPLPQSSQASLGSPRPAMPRSSAYKMNKLHHLNDTPNQLPGGINIGLSRHPNSMYRPAPGSDSILQKNHSVGMPLNQMLDQQNPASFPASSLLSAAAKAQLVNQNKHTDSTLGAGAEARSGSSLGHPGLVGGGRGGNPDGDSTLNQRYLPNPGPLASEFQSGRAALRDKLMGMVQQREANRKRKLSNDGSSGGINNDRAFDVLKHPMGGFGSSSSSFPETLRRMLQQGCLPPNTSMAQLLQSMSHQSAHNGPSHVGQSPARSGKSPFLEEALPQMSTLQQRHHIQGRAKIHGFQNMNSEGQISGQDLNMEQFNRPINQMQDPALTGNFGGVGYNGGQHAVMGSMQGNPNPHQQQQFGLYQKLSQAQGNPHFRGRAGLPPMMSNGGVQALSESGEVSSSLSCELRQAREESLQSLIRNSQARTLQQQRQRQLVQGQHQGLSQGPGQHSIKGQQQHRFQGQGSHPDAPLPDDASSNPMNSLLQSFQVDLPETIPLPNRTMMSRPGMMSGAPCLQEGDQEYQAAQDLPGGVGEVIDTIHRAAMSTASKSTFNVITSTGASGTFAASVVGEPVDLTHAVNSVIHGPLLSYQEPVPEPRHQPKVGRPRKKTPERNNSFSPVAMEAPARFRSPRHGAQRRQWDGQAEGQELAGLWRNDKLLQPLSLAQSRNGTYPERPKVQAQVHLGPQDQTTLHFPSDLYAHMNGNDRVLTSGRLHSRHPSLSPGSSSVPPEGLFTKDYSHYNEHLNGQLNGHHYNGHLNGSLSGEEDLRPGDSPSSSEGLPLHHRPRTPAHYPGDLLWGQGKGFPPWPGKIGSEGHMYSPGMVNGMQGKVESEKFQRTLTEDLDTLHKANKITRNGRKWNNHLEAAIQEAMCELDKMTGNISQRDRQVKTTKPKRRKISR